jgi:hypothetical protein
MHGGRSTLTGAARTRSTDTWPRNVTRGPRAVRVYLDSCILIYRVEGAESFSRPVAELWTNDVRFQALAGRLAVRVIS